jgi:hypothetical protein
MNRENQSTGNFTNQKKSGFWHSFTRWKYLRSALPDLSVAAAYAIVSLGGIVIPHMTRERLAYLITIQFLVIHSFAFLGLLALGKPQMRGQRTAQWVIFVALLTLYTVFAFGAGGFSGILSLYSLAVVNYFGFLLNITSNRAKLHLVTRWATSTFLYAFGYAITGAEMRLSTHHGSIKDNILYFGMLYFAALGLLEWSGFYESRFIRAVYRFFKAPERGQPKKS